MRGPKLKLWTGSPVAFHKCLHFCDKVTRLARAVEPVPGAGVRFRRSRHTADCVGSGLAGLLAGQLSDVHRWAENETPVASRLPSGLLFPLLPLLPIIKQSLIRHLLCARYDAILLAPLCWAQGLVTHHVRLSSGFSHVTEAWSSSPVRGQPWPGGRGAGQLRAPCPLSSVP